MQQGNNQFENYGYDPYEQPPSRGLTEKFFGARIAQRLRSPAVAAAVVLVAGAAFAGIIAGTYSGGAEEEAVPVIRAQADRFKTEPTERGGMDVPHRESTVFNTVGGKPFTGDAPVENLLAAGQEAEPADRLEAFERIAADELQDAEEAASDAPAITEVSEATPTPDQAALEPAAGDGSPSGITESNGVKIISGDPVVPGLETTASAEDIDPAPEKIAAAEPKVIETIEKIPPKDLTQAQQPKAKPPTLHEAGASPETIDFVRDVLDKKDAEAAAVKAAPVASAEPSGEKVASIAPAAGNATTFRIDPAGTHFVQVASVPSPEATYPEWEKLQKQFSQLKGLEYRVSQAEVAGRGTYYRIQAGPFSKEDANGLCEAIKAQKPSGCLVVR